MNFTGERVIPGDVDADLFNEHLARYLFARDYAQGKKVLDAACGTGYGAALLAETAAEVLGADIAPEAIEYARQHYPAPKTWFLRADCLCLPLKSATFDLVVAFEIIEHIRDTAGFLNELRRVLSPDGLLLISTPNRLYYTEDRDEVNPFHEREFSYSEFSETLLEVFPYCSILLENHVAGLLLADSTQAGDLGKYPPKCHQQDGMGNGTKPQRRELEAYYMLALCATQTPSAASPLLYLPSTGNVLRERETHIRRLEEQLAEGQRERDSARAEFRKVQAQLEERTQWAQNMVAELEISQRRIVVLQNELEASNRWAKDLDRQISEKGAYILQLQADYDQKVQWAQGLDQDMMKARRDLQKLQQEFEDRTAWALQLQKELQLLQSTLWYRMGRKLGLKLDFQADPPG